MGKSCNFPCYTLSSYIQSFEELQPQRPHPARPDHQHHSDPRPHSRHVQLRRKVTTLFPRVSLPPSSTHKSKYIKTFRIDLDPFRCDHELGRFPVDICWPRHHRDHALHFQFRPLQTVGAGDRDGADPGHGCQQTRSLWEGVGRDLRKTQQVKSNPGFFWCRFRHVDFV